MGDIMDLSKILEIAVPVVCTLLKGFNAREAEKEVGERFEGLLDGTGLDKDMLDSFASLELCVKLYVKQCECFDGETMASLRESLVEEKEFLDNLSEVERIVAKDYIRECVSVLEQKEAFEEMVRNNVTVIISKARKYLDRENNSAILDERLENG